MIFAELQYDQHYSELHDPIVKLIQSRFEKTDHGLQGDSWIWIFAGEDKVAIDTFSSMQHQVKYSGSNRELLGSVIEVLSGSFQLAVFPEPAIEPHEDI